MKVKHSLIVGLGVTGLAVARYLAKVGVDFDVADQKAVLPEAAKVAEPALSDAAFYGGDFNEALFCKYEQLIVSPGISTRDTVFDKARAEGVEIIGDVELFARAVTRPVIAVTGSNGKSTVVSMVGEMLASAGLRVSVIGNVGLACLDGLMDDIVDVYVLELSSFQLETTYSLRPAASAVLNVCEDHLDRYIDIEDYARVKRHIYNGAARIVYNADDRRTHPESGLVGTSFSISNTNSDWYLKDGCLAGPDTKIDTQVLSVSGGHNRTNALAALALATSVDCISGALDNETFAKGLSTFHGLPHRSEFICAKNDVSWINDSKGTNVGACISAIRGMESPVVLIAGGRGKNADYSPLREAVRHHCRAVILIGEDARKISEVLESIVPVYFEQDMKSAVDRAHLIAQAGDCVLLSPACASFDMFDNFEVRGAVFSDEARRLCA